MRQNTLISTLFKKYDIEPFLDTQAQWLGGGVGVWGSLLARYRTALLEVSSFKRIRYLLV